MAKEPYSTYGGLDAHIPILCICEKCNSAFFAFSHEFFIGKNEEAEYTKIYGHNRLSPGNWIYFRGDVKPGKIKSVFNAPQKEIFVVSYDANSEKKIECEKCEIAEEKVPAGYRLLPSQTADALLGDNIFHTLRYKFGKVVGFVYDGEKDKLAVEFDDESLLFITKSLLKQNLPNKELEKNANDLLKLHFNNETQNVSVYARQGIVFFEGQVAKLHTKRALTKSVQTLPHVRGCVNLLQIQKNSHTDLFFKRAILKIVENPSLQIFNYQVEVQNGVASVSYVCYNKETAENFENLILNIAGLQDLIYHTYSIVTANEKEEEICRKINREFQENAHFVNTYIQANYFQGKILLEGRVSGAIQKQRAFLHAVKIAKTSAIENKIQVF